MAMQLTRVQVTTVRRAALATSAVRTETRAAAEVLGRAFVCGVMLGLALVGPEAIVAIGVVGIGAALLTWDL